MASRARTLDARVAAPAAVVGAVLIAFVPVLVGVRTVVHLDTARLYAPLRALVVEALRAGRLPLWNPHQFAGEPLFAQGIHSVLHPVSLAGALLAPSSVDFLAISYVISAGLGAHALARVLGASPAASAAAGAVFGLSGFTLSMTGNLVFLAGAATLPWIVAAARRAGSGAAFGAPATALAMAAGFLSGDVQATLVGGAVGVALAAEAGGWRGVVRAASGAVAGALLAGVQLSASWVELRQTHRGIALEPLDRLRWSFAPARILEWVVPGLFRFDPGENVAPLFRALGGSEDREIPFAASVYLGAPALVFAALGARGRVGRTLTAAAAILLWLALGHRAGATQLLGPVPLWGAFRYTEKLLGPFTLCVAVLAALGIDRAVREPLAPRARLTLGVAALACGALAVALASSPDAAAAALRAAGVGRGAAAAVATLRSGLVHPAVALALLFAIDTFGTARSARAPAFAALAAGAVLCASPEAGHLAPLDAPDGAPSVHAEADPPGPRLAHPFTRRVARHGNLVGLDATAVFERLLLVPSFNVAARVDDMLGYTGFDSLRFDVLRELGRSRIRMARRFGLTHVVVPSPWNEITRTHAAMCVEGGRLVQRNEGPDFEVWEVPHRRWAFFAASAVAAADVQDALGLERRLLALGEEGPVVVESSSAPPVARGRVLAVSRGTEEVRVEAEADGDALLVVNDAFWPGWRARVDGRPAEILPADVLVRAVRFPAGRHLVAMRYEPREVTVGWAISAAGSLAVAALGWFGVRRARGAQRESGAAAPA